MTKPNDENPILEPEDFSRDDIRSAFLDAHDEPELVQYGRVTVEIRPPNLAGLMKYKGRENDETMMAQSIVDNIYIPGSDERVFDEADIPSLMKLQFSKDMRRLIKKLNQVLGGEEFIQKKIEDNTKSDKE